MSAGANKQLLTFRTDGTVIGSHYLNGERTFRQSTYTYGTSYSNCCASK